MTIRVLVSICIMYLFSFASALPQDGSKTGSFVSKSTSTALMGEEIAASYSAFLGADEEIEWEIHVPANYSPDNPPGILVYVSPQNRINVPTGWTNVTEENNLIWIAARMSGNEINVLKRISFAVMSLSLIDLNYQIDPARIFISGFSGGGRIASIVATEYPTIFKGAIYNSGVNFWQQSNPDLLELIKNHRYVFVTGTDDFNLRDTRQVYNKYKKAGAKNIKLTVIRGMGHENPKRSRFARAIEFLDEN
ncbi:MAG: prolyl oligopeptidase family serine peptidase [Kordiimonadaceae bacterium]|jgi:predicted esterase|nr:prolyl oligopeptidase family serine peptidase [Kordiimonadaceae bacterium]MBT6032543.1 prolyl oligopeptidase family serine peptidase [Kordiimonadaceae bacterium]MBT6328981.1 prolyl oligopeptidase family serine peptidase [Kordiimonadaceae bacterium]